jgi:hypothetical protein
MEQDEAKSEAGKTPEELPPGTTDIQTNKQTNAPKQPKKATANQKQKKWSLWRHWRQAPRTKQVRWVVSAIGGVVAAGTAIALVIIGIKGYQQSKVVFEADHRPKLVFSRPPELLGPFTCEVTDKSIHFQSGPTKIWVKNPRKGDALSAFIAGPMYKLIPEKKTGIPEIDALPSITDETCTQVPPPKMRLFPVHAGDEVTVQLTPTIGIASLIKTNSVTIHYDGSQEEPKAAPGNKPSDTISMAKDARFQAYATICAFYIDENGVGYATCRTYRMLVKTLSTAESTTFSCTQSPMSARFEEAFSGYCEK